MLETRTSGPQPLRIRKDRATRTSEDTWLVSERGADRAACALWWRDVLPHEGHRVGYIGRFSARTEGDGVALVERACKVLRGAGCTLAIAPLDGTTWHPYRFITTRGEEPPFFLEPNHTDTLPQVFRGSHFETLARYHSWLLDIPATGRDPQAQRRVEDLEIQIRPICMDPVESDLGMIHHLAVDSFRNNFLFSPISRASFLELYKPLIPSVDPDLVLLAFRGPELVGFIFGVPDHLETERTGSCTTLIVKTLAVQRGREFAGLGRILVDACHERAREKGYTRSIHALIHDRNISANISNRTGRIIRTYTLFSRPLT